MLIVKDERAEEGVYMPDEPVRDGARRTLKSALEESEVACYRFLRSEC